MNEGPPPHGFTAVVKLGRGHFEGSGGGCALAGLTT